VPRPRGARSTRNRSPNSLPPCAANLNATKRRFYTLGPVVVTTLNDGFFSRRLHVALPGGHINGLRNQDGDLVFSNATVYVPQPEWDWWMDDDRMANAPEAMTGALNATRRVFAPMADSVVKFEPGVEVLPSVPSLPAFGHTPGHTVFLIEGGEHGLL
jgi:hypothetical protein